MKENKFLNDEIKRSLPRSLSEDEQNKIILNIQNGIKVNEMKTKLIESNLRVVVDIAKKYEKYFENEKDAVAIGALGLIRGINTFDYGSKTEILTHIEKSIENQLLKFLKGV